MTSIYQNPTLHVREPGKKTTPETGYDGYVEPDTKIPPKPAKVIKDVTVNGVLIAEADIMAEAQNHPAETPGAALAQAAHALAVRELLLQEAGRLGVAAPAVAGEGKREETGEDAVIRLLIEQEVDVPEAGDEECRRIYTVNRHRFCSDTIYEARHILFAVESTDTKARGEVRGKAENLATHLALHPEEFAGAAEEFSDCPSGRQGGNLGQLTTGSTVSEFERALETMTAGDTTPKLVESRFGFHLIVVDRKIDGEQLPFESVQARIAAWLDAAAWSKAVAQYISILAGKADIQGIDMEASQGYLVQ
ncbi:MAG: peptidylprolyl isomerase [Anderseniella sp.]